MNNRTDQTRPFDGNDPPRGDCDRLIEQLVRLPAREFFGSLSAAIGNRQLPYNADTMVSEGKKGQEDKSA